MLRVIKLYGHLARHTGRRILKADINSAIDAVRFLIANWPELERHITQQSYQIVCGGDAIDESQLDHPVGSSGIQIIPVVGGAGATGKIIAGVALAAAAIIIGQPWLGSFAYSLLIGVGASLALSGVSQLLSPVTQSIGDKMPDAESRDPRKSYSFSGIQNVSRQGVPVPIIFGETICGSVVVSAGIDVSGL